MRGTEKLIYASVAIIFLSVVMKIWLFDIILEFGIRDQICLRKRNLLRGIYLKIPFPLNFKVYFFNVTNPMEIQNGSKPVVKEIGPYWYDQHMEKIDVVDNDVEDSLTYTPYDIFKFNQNKSGLLKEDDYVTILNPLMVGIVNQVTLAAPAFLLLANQSIQHIFNQPESIFVTTKVRDFLFDGMELNCTAKDFSTNAVCSQIKTKISSLKFKKGDKKIYLFSLFGPRNATATRRLKVLRGIKKSKDLGRLIEVDGKKELTIWSTANCNRFSGTDGWIFPPLLTPEETPVAFSTDLCRSFKLNYINDTVVETIKVKIYEGNLGDQTTDEDEKCYCPKPKRCLKKGVFDLTKCQGAPILATLPHFFNTDESYLNQVDGLEPDADKHSIRAHIEPMFGNPVKAALRMQFNLEIRANKKVPQFANLPTSLFPLLWLELSVDLEGDLLKKLQVVFLLLTLSEYFMYFFIVFGIISLAVAVFYHFKNRKEVTITPVYEIKKDADDDYENNDMQNLTRRSKTSDKMGHVNPVMSGHELDRY